MDNLELAPGSIHFDLYLIDRFTIKVIDKNNKQGYFKYNTKTKSVDFYDKNIKNKGMER